MNPEAVRRSLIGALVGAVVFGGMSVYRSLLAEGSLLDYLGPIGMMAVIGGTVGGLVGPLIGEAWRRSRERHRGGSEAAEGGEATGGDVPSHEREKGPGRGASGGRQPFWFTLLVGAAVGWGVGIAWGRVWAGVALGLILALLARRAFR